MNLTPPEIPLGEFKGLPSKALLIVQLNSQLSFRAKTPKILKCDWTSLCQGSITSPINSQGVRAKSYKCGYQEKGVSSWRRGNCKLGRQSKECLQFKN